MTNSQVPGLNIQQPWVELILSGNKTVETRFYKMPSKYENRPVAIIETPGKNGEFKARVVGFVIFGKSIPYENAKVFYSDAKRHLVSPESEFAWKAGKIKWAWPIIKVVTLKTPIQAPKRRGIVFCTDCRIPAKLLPKTLTFSFHL